MREMRGVADCDGEHAGALDGINAGGGILHPDAVGRLHAELCGAVRKISGSGLLFFSLVTSTITSNWSMTPSRVSTAIAFLLADAMPVFRPVDRMSPTNSVMPGKRSAGVIVSISSTYSLFCGRPAVPALHRNSLQASPPDLTGASGNPCGIRL